MLLDFLTRIGKMRGFGIQSPWAYSMVREVFAESMPYYSYEVMDGIRWENGRRKKIAKLYFRIANRLQPTTICCLSQSLEGLTPYIMMGCKRMKRVAFDDIGKYDGRSCVLLSMDDYTDDEIVDIASRCPDESVVIIEGISRTKVTKERWQNLKAIGQLGVAFDIKDSAICFLNRKMYPVCYKLLF